jgi:hypothetical protein
MTKRDSAISLLYDIDDEKIMDRIYRFIEILWRDSYTPEKTCRAKIACGASELNLESLESLCEYIRLLQIRKETS